MSDPSTQGHDSLFDQLGRFETPLDTLPPVDKWNPKLSGVMDMVVKQNGDWIHEGDKIERDKLSRLFSSILKKEGGEYFLVTPVEKWQITIEDQPFSIILMEHGDDGSIKLITNMGESVSLGPNCILVVDDAHEAPSVHIRSNLYARLSRSVFYQLADLAVEEQGAYYLESNGYKMKLG